jgi:hypothetical protein
VEPGSWHDPEFLRDIEARGKSVRVEPGANQSVELTVLTVP